MAVNKSLSDVLSVGEVARRSGLTISTLHFYEKKGLISADRNRGNQRRYSRDILRRLAIIRVATELGFNLNEVSDLLKPIPTGMKPTAKDVRTMIAGWRQAINERMQGLALLRDNLDGCIGCGCLSKDECPLRNPQDKLGEKATGAVLLQREKVDKTVSS